MSGVVVAPNGDIYVGDGHGTGTNDRIVKFAKDGTFVAAWGKHGKAEGEIDTPHGIALDFGGTSLCGRPRQQPHPDFLAGRQVRRRMEAVRPAERRRHRQERRDVRERRAIDRARPIRASSRASGSAASRTARSRPSFRRRTRPSARRKASGSTTTETSMAAGLLRWQYGVSSSSN